MRQLTWCRPSDLGDSLEDVLAVEGDSSCKFPDRVEVSDERREKIDVGRTSTRLGVVPDGLKQGRPYANDRRQGSPTRRADADVQTPRRFPVEWMSFGASQEEAIIARETRRGKRCDLPVEHRPDLLFSLAARCCACDVLGVRDAIRETRLAELLDGGLVQPDHTTEGPLDQMELVLMIN